MVRVHYLGEVNGPVTGIEAGLNSAIKPTPCLAQNGAAGLSFIEVEPMQFIRIPTRVQAETPDPVDVFLIDQVEGEGAARFD